MRILGRYPKNHKKSIRVDYSKFKIGDRVMLDPYLHPERSAYWVIQTDCLTILLDRPIKYATRWNEPIRVDGSFDLGDCFC